MAVHLLWSYFGRGPAVFVCRVVGYAVVAVSFHLATKALSALFFVHLHHWLLGLALLPFCDLPFVSVTVLLSSFSLSQTVEGITRWSAAPPWHPKDKK